MGILCMPYSETTSRIELDSATMQSKNVREGFCLKDSQGHSVRRHK